MVTKNDSSGFMLLTINGNAEMSAAGYDFVPGSSAALALNTWQFVVGTYDGNNIVLYVNGSPVANHARTGVISPGTNPVWLGGRNSYSQYYFPGRIDEVGIWNRALSANEVTDLYNAGSGNQYPFPALTTDTVTITSGTLGFGTGGVASNVTSTQAFGAQSLSGLDITDNGSNFQVDMNDATGTGNGWKVAAETTTNFAHSGTTVSGLLPTFEASPGAVACDTGAGHCTTSSGACISGVTYPVTLTTSSYLSIWDANNTSSCGMGNQTATWTTGVSTGFELVIPANVNLNGQSGLALTATETFQNASGP